MFILWNECSIVWSFWVTSYKKNSQGNAAFKTFAYFKSKVGLYEKHHLSSYTLFQKVISFGITKLVNKGIVVSLQ